MNDIPHIFDDRLRRMRRARAAAGFDAFAFLAEAAAAELSDRIGSRDRDFPVAVCTGARAVRVPRIGHCLRGDVAPAFAGVVFEEGRLPFAGRSLDLYASVLTLHAINDLPGALLQIRRCLKPGGLFVAALFGGETLRELRDCLAQAEIEIDGGLSPRVAPFADIRDAGGLLQRAGFDEPVADVEPITVAYEHPLKLLADLRGMGETNVLVERRRLFLKRAVVLRACEIYFERYRGSDGRVTATFQILYLTGRA
ncbi:MAG: methyltransferase domain-containing protein [Micropepsaceae bacterium]